MKKLVAKCRACNKSYGMTRQKWVVYTGTCGLDCWNHGNARGIMPKSRKPYPYETPVAGGDDKSKLGSNMKSISSRYR